MAEVAAQMQLSEWEQMIRGATSWDEVLHRIGGKAHQVHPLLCVLRCRNA